MSEEIREELETTTKYIPVHAEDGAVKDAEEAVVQEAPAQMAEETAGAETERRMSEHANRRNRKQSEGSVFEKGWKSFVNLVRTHRIGTAAVAGVLVFALLTGVLVNLRTRGESSVVVGVVDVITESGNDEGGELIFNAEERLSSEMTPIVIDTESPFYEAFTSGDRVNVMVLGVNQNMTDTIMIGSYDMQNQTMDIISIPRDTFYYRKSYANANYGFHKINAVYRTEGIAPLAEAVSSLLYGMPLHYYAIVEYDDIRKVIDAVGGVEINIPFHMKYQDTTPGEELYIDIPAGNQVIDSSNVIEFLRFRHTNGSYAAQGYKSYTRGDIDRIEVQQGFVKAFIKKCMNLGNLKEVAKVTLENVESDMTYTMATKIALKALDGFKTDNMTSYTLPGNQKIMQELSFWVCSEDETYSMLETIYHIGEDSEGADTQADNN